MPLGCHLRQVEVPAAVVVTTQDRIVPASRQLQPARAIPGAAIHRVGADHAVCITAPQLFARRLLEACPSVQARPGRDGPAPGLPG